MARKEKCDRPAREATRATRRRIQSSGPPLVERYREHDVLGERWRDPRSDSTEIAREDRRRRFSQVFFRGEAHRALSLLLARPGLAVLGEEVVGGAGRLEMDRVPFLAHLSGLVRQIVRNTRRSVAQTLVQF